MAGKSTSVVHLITHTSRGGAILHYLCGYDPILYDSEDGHAWYVPYVTCHECLAELRKLCLGTLPAGSQRRRHRHFIHRVLMHNGADVNTPTNNKHVVIFALCGQQASSNLAPAFTADDTTCPKCTKALARAAKFVVKRYVEF